MMQVPDVCFSDSAAAAVIHQTELSSANVTLIAEENNATESQDNRSFVIAV